LSPHQEMLVSPVGRCLSPQPAFSIRDSKMRRAASPHRENTIRETQSPLLCPPAVSAAGRTKRLALPGLRDMRLNTSRRMQRRTPWGRTPCVSTNVRSNWSCWNYGLTLQHWVLAGGRLTPAVILPSC
jgi:hypothetical protein